MKHCVILGGEKNSCPGIPLNTHVVISWMIQDARLWKTSGRLRCDVCTSVTCLSPYTLALIKCSTFAPRMYRMRIDVSIAWRRVCCLVVKGMMFALFYLARKTIGHH